MTLKNTPPTEANSSPRFAESSPAIISYLRAAGANQEAARIEACCKTPVIFYEPVEGKTLFFPRHCNSRFCPVCGPYHQTRIAKSLVRLMQHFNSTYTRVITLTQRDIKNESLESASERFRAALKRLRNRKSWIFHVHGYYIKYEVTFNELSNHWHYHAHILYTGSFWPFANLRAEWNLSCNDKTIVDIRPVNVATIADLSKYVTKLRGKKHFPYREFTEYLDHHRMFSFGGSFVSYLHEITDPLQKEPGPSNYLYIGNLSDAVRILQETSNFLYWFPLAAALISNSRLWPKDFGSSFATVRAWLRVHAPPEYWL